MITFEQESPREAAYLQSLYAKGWIYRAYIWRRGFRVGVGQAPHLINFADVIMGPNEQALLLPKPCNRHGA